MQNVSRKETQHWKLKKSKLKYWYDSEKSAHSLQDWYVVLSLLIKYMI